MAEHGLPSTPSQRRLRVVRVLTAVALVTALAAAVTFRDHLRDLRRYGYVAVFLVGLVSNATLILPVPGLAVSSVMGGVFNPWVVGLVAGVGQALGELTGYMAGYSGHVWVDEHPRYRRLVLWTQRYGVFAIFLMALFPNPVFDVAGMAAGVLRLPVWKFLVSCAAGKVIKNVLFAIAGSYGIGALFQLPLGD
ncbi:MAG: VTT domain-containing protein [Anaerolineae bacterium]|jgi:membrane protein YqaA with SNARE-associated domain